MTTYAMQEGAEGGGDKGGQLMFWTKCGARDGLQICHIRTYTQQSKGQRLLLQELSRCTDRFR